MQISFHNSAPIYLQIVDEFKRRLASGAIAPGEKIAPVRELAPQLGVNPNTLQRALAQLEEEGLLRAERTTGRYATGDDDRLKGLKAFLIAHETAQYAGNLQALGAGKAEALDALAAYYEGKEAPDDGSAET